MTHSSHIKNHIHAIIAAHILAIWGITCNIELI